MPSFSVDFEVYCDECGAGLCGQSKGVNTRTRGEPSVRVMPCKACLDAARKESFDEGYQQGREEVAAE